jgi:hypothetical protein
MAHKERIKCLQEKVKERGLGGALLFYSRDVITLEMHMLREDAGVVKLEDMILIKHNGNELLTRSPRRLFEI